MSPPVPQGPLTAFDVRDLDEHGLVTFPRHPIPGSPQAVSELVRWAADTWGSREALVTPTKRLTFDDIQALSARTALVLKEAVIRTGYRVAGARRNDGWAPVGFRVL